MEVSSTYLVCLLGGVLAFLVTLMGRRMLQRYRELRRFETNEATGSFFSSTSLARTVFKKPLHQLMTEGRILITAEELCRLQDVGPGDADGIVRYVVLRELWIAITLLVCFYSLSVHSAVFAALFTCAAIVLAVWVPRGLLDLEWEARKRGVSLEIPIVFGLLASALRAGAEVVRVFDDCADILYGKHNRATFANSLVRAKWRSRVVGSWFHGLTSDVRASSGPLLNDALDKLATVMRPDVEDIDGRLQTMTQEAHNRLVRDLTEHQRLVAIKVVVLLSASIVGGVLLSGLPFSGSWGG